MLYGSDGGERNGKPSDFLLAHAMTRAASGDPLAKFPAFAEEVRARLDRGRLHYGDRSFSSSPGELLDELSQEALDLAGWAFILFRRIEAMRLAIAEPGDAERDDE